jgi:hypothetical protein
VADGGGISVNANLYHLGYIVKPAVRHGFPREAFLFLRAKRSCSWLRVTVSMPPL